MSGIPWYKKYPADYLCDTAHLTLGEHGAYTLLIDIYYSSGHPIAYPMATLYRMCRCEDERDKGYVDSILDQFFVNRKGVYHHKRIDEELEKYNNQRSFLSDKGKLGAKIRWEKENGLPHSLPHENPNGVSMANQKLESILPAPPTKRSRAPRINGHDPSETWNAYASSYQERYGVAPVRNASVNSQLKQFVDRVGVENAPNIAAFYCKHNGAKYTNGGHQTKLLLMDAEKLSTEWRTNRQITQTAAMQADKKQANSGVYQSLMQEFGHENPKP